MPKLKYASLHLFNSNEDIILLAFLAHYMLYVKRRAKELCLLVVFLHIDESTVLNNYGCLRRKSPIFLYDTISIYVWYLLYMTLSKQYISYAPPCDWGLKIMPAISQLAFSASFSWKGGLACSKPFFWRKYSTFQASMSPFNSSTSCLTQQPNLSINEVNSIDISSTTWLSDDMHINRGISLTHALTTTC